MERREFLTAGGAAIADWGLRIADWSGRTSDAANPQSAIRNPQSRQEPSVGPEVFQRRLDRARAELRARGLRCLIATPGTNYEYLTGYNPGRSERLIALILPLEGAPAVVCPSFETERIKRHSTVADARGWDEQDDPYVLVRDTVRRLAPRAGTIALESSTGYQTSLRLADALPGWKFVDAAPVTERLRIVKAPEEVALIRRAIGITQSAMTATFGQLVGGMTERGVARRVITAAGYGAFFTHRLGHGLGMDGHEPPYLVEGNALRLEPAMVFTDEPGIYQLGKFGVRIEDDCVMTEKGVEVLSQRASKL